MIRGLIILVSWLCVTTAWGQSGFNLILNKDGKIVALPKNKSYELNIPKSAYKNFTPSGSRDIDIKLREFKPDIPYSNALEERPMDMQISSAAYQPFFNVYTPMIMEVSPMALDFNETYIKRLNESFDLIANGVQYSWPGSGGMTMMNSGISWHNDRWSLYGGGFGGRFYTPFNRSPGIGAGGHTQVEFHATDWLNVKAWGSYAYYADEFNNPHMLKNPFLNHTQVGGAFEFKVTDNFWIGTGINYQFNPVRHRMEPQFLLYPIFKSGGIHFGR